MVFVLHIFEHYSAMFFENSQFDRMNAIALTSEDAIFMFEWALRQKDTAGAL